MVLLETPIFTASSSEVYSASSISKETTFFGFVQSDINFLAILLYNGRNSMSSVFRNPHA